MRKSFSALLAASVFAVGTWAHAATYEVDSESSEVIFYYKQMGVQLDGRFTGLSGNIDFDANDPDSMSAQIELPLSSVDTGNDEANDELEKPEWFDLNAHPTATFSSTQVTPADAGQYTVDGVLEIKGHTQTLSLPVNVQQMDNGVLLFETEFEIDRGTFEVGSGSWSDPSIVANEVKIKASILAQ